MNAPMEIAQRTPGWVRERIGHVTASRMNDVHDIRKDGKPGAKRLEYLNDVVHERLHDRAVGRYVTAAMERGTLLEPVARAEYEVMTGRLVRDAGFMHHNSIEFFGASPDGHVGSGLIEIKVPSPTNYTAIVRAGVVPDQYKLQMLAQMAVTGADWCDFVAFNDEAKEGRRLFVRRFHRNEAAIEQLELKVIEFLNEIDEEFERVLGMPMIEL